MPIVPLTTEHRGLWEPLWQAYLAFYGQQDLPPSTTDGTFARLTDPTTPTMAGFLAFDNAGAACGLVHCVFHPNTWNLTPVCYLEDLFVADSARGQGVGRALIAAVTTHARSQGSHKVYWHTHADNRAARTLYDRLTPVSSFVRYDLPLPPAG